MIAAAALLGYAACAAWLAPALLAPLTRRGLSVRAGLAAWLAAMASVLVSAVTGLQFAIRAVAADWPQLTQDLCRSVAGSACTPQVYDSTTPEGMEWLKTYYDPKVDPNLAVYSPVPPYTHYTIEQEKACKGPGE